LNAFFFGHGDILSIKNPVEMERPSYFNDLNGSGSLLLLLLAVVAGALDATGVALCVG
jgi:hypothetical protein